MTWEELLEAYRSLGGRAENVRLGHGPRGRGVFAIDPSKPAVLHTPLSMMVPVESIVARDGVMTTTAETLGEGERRFFDDYERYFGWGAGGFEESYEQQSQWHALSPEIVAELSSLVMGGAQWRFAAPAVEACRAHYLRSRSFSLANGQFLVPMMDLVNHAGDVPRYGARDGFSVSGTFADEMLVSYNVSDAWGQVLIYGFHAESPIAYSLAITIALPDGRRLSIARNPSLIVTSGDIQLPKAEVNGNEIVLSFVLLGHKGAMDLPRTMFRAAAAPFVTAAETDRIFESVAHYNRTRFIGLLRLLRAHQGPLVRSLEEAIINQLDAISACVGARAL